MNWKFWKKKEVKKETVVEWTWNTDIYFHNNTHISFSQVCAEESVYRDIFKDFYCWHKFGKTDEYEFIYNNGAYLFKRKDIRMIHYYRRKQTK